MRDLDLAEPVAVVQAAGDALLLDLRTFHFGAANTSEALRVQLSATFREPAAPGDDGSDGFTYALREELVGSRTLGDFLPTSSHVGPRAQVEAQHCTF